MQLYEIELHVPLAIKGRKRPAGWSGIVTKSYVTKMNRAGAGVVVREVPRSELFGEMTKKELSDECARRGYKTTGSKDELLDRLVNPSKDELADAPQRPEAEDEAE